MIAFMFYIWGLLALWYEFWKLRWSNYLQLDEIRKKGKQLKGDKNILKKLTEGQKIFCVLSVLYMFWAIVGLFTSQWILFIGIFLVSQLNRVFKNYLWNIADSILTASLILFIIINRYHLHINVPKAVWNFLGF